jgi:hypothetical protein
MRPFKVRISLSYSSRACGKLWQAKAQDPSNAIHKTDKNHYVNCFS